MKFKLTPRFKRKKWKIIVLLLILIIMISTYMSRHLIDKHFIFKNHTYEEVLEIIDNKIISDEKNAEEWFIYEFHVKFAMLEALAIAFGSSDFYLSDEGYEELISFYEDNLNSLNNDLEKIRLIAEKEKKISLLMDTRIKSLFFLTENEFWGNDIYEAISDYLPLYLGASFNGAKNVRGVSLFNIHCGSFTYNRKNYEFLKHMIERYEGELEEFEKRIPYFKKNMHWYKFMHYIGM